MARAPNGSTGRDRNRRWLAWAVPLWIGALVVGVLWAMAPEQRQRVLMRVPLRLAEGQAASGSFRPEHEGPFGVGVEFPLARPLDEIGALVAGGWREPGPPGFALSWTIRNGGDPIVGATTDRFPGGSWRREAAAVDVAHVWRGRDVPSAIEARVDSAVPGLAGLEAYLVVEATGDWVNYAWLETIVRGAIVGVGAAVSIGAIAFVAWRRERRARRATEAAESRTGAT